MTFTFECPNCGQHISASPADSGIEAVCPNCSNALTVPTAPECSPTTEAATSEVPFTGSVTEKSFMNPPIYTEQYKLRVPSYIHISTFEKSAGLLDESESYAGNNVSLEISLDEAKSLTSHVCPHCRTRLGVRVNFSEYYLVESEQLATTGSHFSIDALSAYLREQREQGGFLAKFFSRFQDSPELQGRDILLFRKSSAKDFQSVTNTLRHQLQRLHEFFADARTIWLIHSISLEKPSRSEKGHIGIIRNPLLGWGTTFVNTQKQLNAIGLTGNYSEFLADGTRNYDSRNREDRRLDNSTYPQDKNLNVDAWAI